MIRGLNVSKNGSLKSIGVFGEEAQDGLDLEIGPAPLQGLQPCVPGRREQEMIGSDPHLVANARTAPTTSKASLGWAGP